MLGSRTRLAATVAGALVLAAQLHAAMPQSARVDELREARNRVARAAAQEKGGAQQRLLQDKQRLDALIDDLEHGRAVDPSDIDRALERAENPGVVD